MYFLQTGEFSFQKLSFYLISHINFASLILYNKNFVQFSKKPYPAESLQSGSNHCANLSYR